VSSTAGLAQSVSSPPLKAIGGEVGMPEGEVLRLLHTPKLRRY